MAVDRNYSNAEGGFPAVDGRNRCVADVFIVNSTGRSGSVASARHHDKLTLASRPRRVAG